MIELAARNYAQSEGIDTIIASIPLTDDELASATLDVSAPVLPAASLDVGFGGPAQDSSPPSRSIRPAIPTLPFLEHLIAPRLVIASSLVSKVGPRMRILTHEAMPSSSFKYRGGWNRDLRKSGS
jgi:hypothetical protein